LFLLWLVLPDSTGVGLEIDLSRVCDAVNVDGQMFREEPEKEPGTEDVIPKKESPPSGGLS